jgi:preprotein translocase subunit SecG
MLLILNVVYVLLAIGMIALILMQRGAGAQAGSGFGAGASATVFGATGASNFLSKATKWLAIAFMLISLFMAWYATRSAAPVPASQDLGVMDEMPAAPAAPAGTQPVPAVPAPAQEVPAAPATDAAPGQQAPETVPAVPEAGEAPPAEAPPADDEG